LTADLDDNSFVTASVNANFGTTLLDTIPETLPELVYANFPISVDSVLHVTDGTKTWDFEAPTGSIWPKCDFATGVFQMEHTIIDSEGSKLLRIEPKFSATVGPYCSPILGLVSLSLNGEPTGSVSVPASVVESADLPTSTEPIVVPFYPGKYCATFELKA
jgi:hypothetical protein